MKTLDARRLLLPLCLTFGSPAMAQELPAPSEDEERDEEEGDEDEEEGETEETDAAEEEAEDTEEVEEAADDEEDAVGDTEEVVTPTESRTGVQPDDEEKAENAPTLPAPGEDEVATGEEKEPRTTPPPSVPGDVLDRAEEATLAAGVDTPEKTEPSLWPLKVGASFFVRPEVREGYDELGVSRGRFQEGDQTVFRARLSLETNSLKLTDDIGAHAYFAPQASGQFGTSGIGGTIGEANLGIYEGYFRVTSKRLDFTAGRFAMNYGEAMVIGNLDWHQSGRAFDGLHAHYKMREGYIDFFGTQLAEAWPASTDPFLAGDTYFWGAYAGLGQLISETIDLDAYLLGLSATATEANPTTGGTLQRDGATLFHLGLRFKQALAFFDYRFEGGVQAGETVGAVAVGPDPDGTLPAVETLAYHADLELGVAPVEGIRIAIGGLIASGDDPTTARNEGYNELFPTGHKFLGLMDVFGSRTNAASGYLKYNMGLTDSLALAVDGHLFARVEPNGLDPALLGPSNLGQVGGDNFAGGEVDTQLIQKIGKWVSVRGLYGIFIPNENHYAESDPAHYVEVQAGLTY